MPLLRRRRLVGFQDRVDHRNQRSELRPLRSLGSHIAGRRRIAAHLGNRIPAQSENPRRLAPALPFDEDKPSNRCVNLHREHPRPSLFESDFEKVRPRKWPGFTPPRATALCRRSVAYYCTAAHRPRSITPCRSLRCPPRRPRGLDLNMGQFSVEKPGRPGQLSVEINSSALGCGIAGDHRLHRRRSLFVSPTGRDLGDPQTSENWHLHKIQDDGEGSGGNKRAGHHPCRQGRHRKASDC